jgi:hypothetical protein
MYQNSIEINFPKALAMYPSGNNRIFLIMMLMAGIMAFRSAPVLAQDAYIVPAGCRIISSGSQGLRLQINPVFKGFDTVYSKQRAMLIPRIAGASVFQSAPGTPMQIIMEIPVTVPGPQGFSLNSVQALQVRRISGMMAPIPYPVRRQPDDPADMIYSADPDAYAAMPAKAEWVKLLYSGIAGSRHIAILRIILAHYDAASGHIEMPSSVQIALAFKENSGQFLQGASPAYDPAITVNHVQGSRWRINTGFALAKKTEKVSALSSGKWLRIITGAQGIYRIDAGQLAAAGLGISAADIPTLKVFGNGGVLLPENPDSALQNSLKEQPIIVKTKSDGSLDALYFYAEAVNGFRMKDGDFRHFTHPYIKENVYLITAGGNAGLRAMATDLPPAQQVQHKPVSFMSRVFVEDEIYNPYVAASGRTWFGQTIESAVPRVYSTILTGLARNAGDIVYRYSVAHKTTRTGYFTLSESGTTIDTTSLRGTNPLDSYYNYVESVSSPERGARFPAGSIASDNRSVLRFSYSSPEAGPTSSGYVDWFEILYPRQLLAAGNQLELFTDSSLSGIAEYNINQFSGSEILAFDITDPAAPVLQANAASTGGMFILRTSLKAGSPRRYFIASEFRSPRLENAEIAGLRDDIEGADMLLITHKDLLQSAQAYKQYRESRGEITVKIVTTDQIYNEFAGGAADVTALRDYSAYALKNWRKKPHYLFLWGDGHYDYKNIQIQGPNYVPPYQTYQEYGIFNSTVTACMDDYYARVAGNDPRVDLANGRMPVASQQEGEWLVEKIKLYETKEVNGPWQTTVCLVADDGPVGQGTEGTQHTNQSEALAREVIPAEMQLRKIYMAEYPVVNIANGRRKPAVTQQLLADINNNGAVLLNWIGHGSPRVWAHERIFEKETTIPLMSNLDRLFFLTAATCDFARFDDGERESGAEDLIRSRTGGAIGVFAATRLVYSFQNSLLCEELYRNIFSRDQAGRHLTIGEAMYKTKQTQNDDNSEKYLVLGDPAMRLKIPDYLIKIDTINGMAVSADTAKKADSLLPRIKALQRVRLNGRICSPSDSLIAADFNGSVLLTLKDTDMELKVLDPTDNVVHDIEESGGLLNRSAYPVQNGRFSASFVVPKDISFSGSRGRLYGYAFSSPDAGTSTKYGMGISRGFTVGDIDESGETDIKGPEISIYMDDRSFRSGNLVRRSPLLIIDLFDDTGINATGAGIGHKIEAWFDSDPMPVDLTSTFQTSLEDARRGSAGKRIFNLPLTTTSVRVRAWDVWNNYSEAQTFFRLAESDSLMEAEGLEIAPNPMDTRTAIRLNHNQSQPLAAEIRIFATDGRLVHSAQFTRPELHSWIYEWNGLDNAGNAVGSGAYICTVRITQGNGAGNIMSGKLMILRP